MANQKTYNIKINGIEKSIGEVDVLIAQIESLEKKLNTLQKKEVSVKGDANVAKELAKQAKLQSDEYKVQLQELEKIKAENKAIAQQQKDIALGVRNTNGEYTHTLAGQRAYLAEIKKQLAGTELNTDEWKTLRDRVSEVNQTVKELEQSYGVFTRNVGNYESAANGFANIKTEVVETNDALETLRNSAKIKVDVAGTTIEFENLSQAIGEIDDMAQKAAAQMQMLAVAGEQNSDAYKEATETFQTYVSKAGELEKARKYSDELKDSLASQSRELDLTVQGFQAVTGAMQVAAGVQGLFGKDQEELNEAMNKTVQLMGIAQGVQEIYNQTVQSGTLLNKVYTASQAGVNKAIAALGVSAKSSTVGVKALKVALNGLGIGLIITAVSLLIEHWEDLVGWFKETFQFTDKLSGAFDRLKQVFMGVGNVILQYIIQPFKGASEAIKALLQGDFSGAAQALTNSFKNQFNVVQNYQKGVTEETKKQTEKRLKIEKENLDKELDYKIKILEAEKGTDAKYTNEGQKLYKQFYDNKLSLYEKDTEEYKQASLDRLKFINETERYQLNRQKNLEKEATESAQKNAEKQRQLAESYVEQNKKAFDEMTKRVTLMNQWEELSSKYQITEYERILNLYNNLSKFNSNELTTPLTAYGRESERVATELQANFDKINDIYTAFASKIKTINQLKFNKEKFNLDLEGNQKKGNIAQQMADMLFELEKEVTTNPSINIIREELETLFTVAIKDGTNSPEGMKVKENLDNLFKIYNEEFNKYSTEQLDLMTKAERNEYATQQRHFNDLVKLYEDYSLQINSVDQDIILRQLSVQNEQDKVEREFVRDKFAYLVDAYSYEYEDLMQVIRDYEVELSNLSSSNQNADILGKLFAGKANRKQFKKVFDDLFIEISTAQEELTNKLEAMTKQKSEKKNMVNAYMESIGLDPSSSKDRAEPDNTLQTLIAESNAVEVEIVAIKQYQQELQNLQNQINDYFKSTKLSLDDWATIANSVANETVNIYSSINEMLYNNESKRIEDLQEQYDKELEMLDEELAAKEELYEKYNDKINDLEDELENARGSRRQHLMEQIAKEIDARENAYNEQVRIANEQKRIEQQKQKLEEQARQAEIRRLKAQKVSDIAEATINTAVAVTKALKTSRIYAAVVAALGAAQIATIASTRYYADGGVLQGNSHANGGIKVLGGYAEVEGGEYVTNKYTTSKNVELLSFINSKKKRIDLQDLVEFYNGSFSGNRLNYNRNYKYSNGGQLPKDLNNQNISYVRDDRPIVVSVTEINDVNERVRQVKALAGL